MSAQSVASLGDLEPGEAMRLELDAADGSVVEVALIRDDDGTVHAISDTCSHQRVSLSDGEIEDGTVECWLHGARFDVRTGAAISLPATRAVPVYPVTIDGEEILVDVDNREEN